MINKKLFEVSQEEKNRILGLHESATKRLYIIKEQQDIKFSFPPLKKGGYGQSQANLEMTGLYTPGKGLYFTWLQEDIYGVLDKSALYADPNWIIKISNNTTPFDSWIRQLNKDFLNDNGPIFYVPTYDKNNMQAVWVGFQITSKTKRSKRGIGALIGLGKRYQAYSVKIIETIPTGYTIPQN